jgi:hypothetical protein
MPSVNIIVSDKLERIQKRTSSSMQNIILKHLHSRKEDIITFWLVTMEEF